MVEKQTVEMHEVDQESGWSWGSHVRAPGRVPLWSLSHKCMRDEVPCHLYLYVPHPPRGLVSLLLPKGALL